MPTSEQRARYEAHVSRAAVSLYRAEQAADAMGDEGASQDLQQLRLELRRLCDLSLRGKRAPLRGQLALDT